MSTYYNAVTNTLLVPRGERYICKPITQQPELLEFNTVKINDTYYQMTGVSDSTFELTKYQDLTAWWEETCEEYYA